MALNDPREIDYDFKVFEMDGWVWLFDDSERTYPCTTRPHIWAEAAYPLCDTEAEHDEAMEYWPDGGYFLSSEVEKVETVEVLVVDHTEETDKTAWDDARDEANGNHRI